MNYYYLHLNSYINYSL